MLDRSLFVSNEHATTQIQQLRRTQKCGGQRRCSGAGRGRSRGGACAQSRAAPLHSHSPSRPTRSAPRTAGKTIPRPGPAKVSMVSLRVAMRARGLASGTRQHHPGLDHTKNRTIPRKGKPARNRPCPTFASGGDRQNSWKTAVHPSHTSRSPPCRQRPQWSSDTTRPARATSSWTSADCASCATQSKGARGSSQPLHSTRDRAKVHVVPASNRTTRSVHQEAPQIICMHSVLHTSQSLPHPMPGTA